MTDPRLALLCVVTALAASCAMPPIGDTAYHQPGLYVGGMQTTTLIYGDLEDESLVVGDDDFGMIPAFDGEPGVGLAPLIGYRWHSRSLELSYLWSDFDEPEFLGLPIEAEQTVWSLDWKQHYLVDQRLQPFVYAGLSYLRMELEDAAASTIGPEIADVIMKGTGINVGAGANYYVSPNLALFGQVTWSFVRYDRASTVFPPEMLDGDIDGDSLNLSFGASYTF